MLRELIDMIFKKKPVINEESISRIKDIVPMPSRTEFANDSGKQALIDEYKKEYLKTLRLARIITSIDIMPEELHDYQNIYYDLLMNLFEVEESEVSFASPNDIIDEELELSIKCLKLRLYLSNVRELIIETKLRLIALDEILKEKKLSKTKENAVLNEINNTLHSLFIFQSQEWTMIKAIHDNLIVIKNLDLKTFLENIDNPNIEEDNDEVINKRLEEVREMALIVIPDIVGYLESLNLSPKVLIATLEQELEMYVYTHRDELKTCEEKMNKLNYEVMCRIHTDIEYDSAVVLSFYKNKKYIGDHQEKYLKEIRRLELVYKIFSKYGRNLVSNDDLEKFYRIKFEVLLSDFTKTNWSDFESATFKELEVYQEIIFEKINKILSEHYVSSFLAKTDEISINELLVIIKNCFQIEGEFSAYKILNNRILLSLLMAFDNDSLNKFFNETYVNIKDYPEIDFYKKGIDWEEKVPLSSIYEMMYYNIRASDKEEFKSNPLYRIYKLYRNTLPKDIYKFPEGIKRIYGGGIPGKLYTLINEECKNKIVIMPNTLKAILSDIFSSDISEIVLNKGFEHLGSNALYHCSNFNLPATINFIHWDTFNFKKICKLMINDYKNSAFLNNKDFLRNLISNCYTAHGTKRKRYHHVSDEARKKQKMERTGRFSSSDHSYLFDHDEIFEIFELQPSFQEIAIEDETGKIVRLNKEDLTIEIERSEMLWDSNIFGLKLNVIEVSSVINHIMNQIAIKFNEVEDLEVSKRERKPE